MSGTSSREEIILRRRKHWFVLFSHLLGPVLAALFPFFVYALIAGREIALGERTLELLLSTALFAYLSAAWLLLWWMSVVSIWTDYYLDVWIVTTRRIIDREQKGLFHRETSIFRLERVQDVTVETRGLFPTLLHFGDLHVQTAGEAREFIMRGIANPKYVREVILRQMDKLTDSASTRRPADESSPPHGVLDV